jgi:hypothetical protein
MSKFKVEDRVECISRKYYWTASAGINVGDIGTVREVDGTWAKLSNSKGLWVELDDFRKIGEPMSKYQELSDRIDRLNNGWDKEADDLLQEINSRIQDGYMALCISIRDNHYGWVKIRKYSDLSGNSDIIEKFFFESQCEKMSAFKQALHYLLDHSDIKKDLVGEEVKAEIEGKVYKVKVLDRA